MLSGLGGVSAQKGKNPDLTYFKRGCVITLLRQGRQKENLNEIITKLNVELKKEADWFRANELSLNLFFFILPTEINSNKGIWTKEQLL